MNTPVLFLVLGFSFETSEKGKLFAENIVGPILPGPPRLLDFRIEGDVKEGGTAKIEADYIGGYEGASEYWWMRIYPTGQRTQITQPTAIPSNGKGSANDPRCYKLTKGKTLHISFNVDGFSPFSLTYR
ncbi:hypothetical protein EON65_33770 [archaeon]|nr:MAG: hypothetical protein EON65_33770 [archaeon]